MSAARTLNFLTALFRPAPRSFLVELAYMPSRISRFVRLGDGSTHDELPKLKDGAKGLARAFAWNRKTEGSAIFFSVHPRDAAGRTNSNVPLMCALVADIDTKNEESWETLPEKVASLSIPPSAWVNTGHGQHFYWFLKEAQPSTGCPSQARAVMYRLQKYLGSDMVHDPARILRLPGSVNWKDGHPVATKIGKFDPTRRYDLPKIEEALDAIAAPRWELPASILQLPKGSHRAGLDSQVTLLAKRTRKLPPVSTRILDLIQHGHRPGCGYPSRSEVDLAVTNALVRAGADLPMVERIFADYPVGARAAQMGPGYVSRLYDMALAFISRGSDVAHVKVSRVFVDELPGRDGCPPATRWKLEMVVLSPHELEGRTITNRFYGPSGERPWAALRWGAVWRAIGRRPPKDCDLAALAGRELDVEVSRGDFTVLSYLPRAARAG